MVKEVDLVIIGLVYLCLLPTHFDFPNLEMFHFIINRWSFEQIQEMDCFCEDDSLEVNLIPL